MRPPFVAQVNGLGLPISAAEARLLVTEYGGIVEQGQGEGGKERERQLSLGDFDSMIRPRPSLSPTVQDAK